MRIHKSATRGVLIFLPLSILAGCVSFKETDTSRPGRYRVKKELFSANGNTTLTIHVYGQNGRRVKSLKEFSSGEKGTMEYTYDARGYLTREYYHATTSTYAFAVTYENDEKGKPVKRKMVMDITNQSETAYEYDPNGRLLRTKTESKSGATSSTSYVYGVDGRIERTITTGGEGYATSYRYDKKGYLVKELTFGANGNPVSTVRYTYELY